MSVSQAGDIKAGGMVGHARFLAEPAFQRLVALEPWLKRAIPVLIIIFLAVVFSARTASLMAERDSADQTARMFLSLLADSGQGALREAAANDMMPQTPAAYERVLSRTLPTEALISGRMFLVTDVDGTVIAQRGGEDRIGQNTQTFIEGMQPLALFGQGAGVLETIIDERPYLAAAARIADTDALFLILQDKAEIFASWRRRASMNVTLFVATSSILLVLLYAYFAQVARAHEADLVYCETQKRVDLALTRGHCGLWDWDLARGRIYWSQSMFEMLGYRSGDEVLSFGEVARYVHPDDADLFDLAEKAAARDIVRVDRTLRMRHAEGYFIRLRLRTEAVEHPVHGIHLIGIAVDMTEQHRLAELSQLASDNLQAAIESTSESFALWDRDGKLVLYNHRFIEHNGLEEVVLQPGMARADVDALIRTPVSERRIPHPQEGGTAITCERQIADGRWLQINERATPSGGRISVGSDITPLKMQEERLIVSERRLMATNHDLVLAQRAALEKAVALEEINQKFFDAKERAEAANRAKAEFLANVSHELRTPLNAIIGFSEMIQRRILGPIGNPRYEEYIDDIHESGAFLLNVINDILEMSKIEAGRLVLDREPIDLQPIIEETMQMTAFLAQPKSIAVVTEIAPGMQVEADRRAIKQILINLLTNAIKFTGDQGQVRIRAKCVGCEVRIYIEDNGCGIPAAALQRLGKPFEQVQNQFSKNHSGSGLGLAISRSLTEMHGGALKIRSRVGRGTVVSVRLPCATGDHEAKPDAA